MDGKTQVGAEGVDDLLPFPDKTIIGIEITGDGKKSGKSDTHQKYRKNGEQQNSCAETVSVHGNLQ